MGSLIIPANLEHWKHRAVRETGGNTTLMGCFVLAICGWQSGRKPPRFGKVARISREGILYSNMQDKDWNIHERHCLGPVQTVIDNFRGLADHLKLTDAERIEMFQELTKWCAIDERADIKKHKEERGLTGK